MTLRRKKKMGETGDKSLLGNWNVGEKKERLDYG